MKKIFYLMVVILCFSQNVLAQSAPESYLKKAPGIPKNTCTASFEEVTSFTDAIKALKEEIKKDADSRTEALGSDANREKAARQYLGNTGLSASDIEKLQNENLSEEESTALALRIASGQNANMPSKSATDIRKGNVPPANTFAFLERHSSEMVSLSQAQEKYYNQNVLPVEQEETLSSGSMDAQKKWQTEHRRKLLNARKRYCENFSPKRIKLIEALKSRLKEEMNNVRKHESQQMANVGANNQDIELLNMVDSYLGELKEVYSLNVTDYQKNF